MTAMEFTLLLVSCFGAPPARTESPPDPTRYQTVLRAVVRGEGVDYLTLRADHLADLEGWLAAVAKVDFEALSTDDKVGLGVDLYNATVMREVALRFRAGYSVAENEFGLFKEKLVRVGGELRSLDDLEHGILRTFRVPEIHGALVCGARSCPPLANTPFAGPGSPERIVERMREFVRDPTRNRVDHVSRKLQLSKVFDWFSQDFGGRERVAAYLARFLGDEVVDYAVEYREYDWTVNLAPIEGERWVEVVPDSLVVRREEGGAGSGPNEETLTAGEILEAMPAAAGTPRDQRRCRRADGAVFLLPAVAVRVFHNS